MSEQKALPLTWPQRFGREDFIVAECNKEAFDAVIIPDKWPIPITVLIGPKACGKSHLSAIFQQVHNAFVVRDADDIDQALADHPTHIVADDADKIADDERLFHLFNSILTRKARLLMTASSDPKKWIELPDLLSRVKASHYISIENPDEEMIKLAYQKLFNDRGLFLDAKVLDYLALRTERSFAGVLKNADALDQAALANKKRITIPLIQDSHLF